MITAISWHTALTSPRFSNITCCPETKVTVIKMWNRSKAQIYSTYVLLTGYKVYDTVNLWSKVIAKSYSCSLWFMSTGFTWTLVRLKGFFSGKAGFHINFSAGNSSLLDITFCRIFHSELTKSFRLIKIIHVSEKTRKLWELLKDQVIYTF